jgi:hypothetical protein
MTASFILDGIDDLQVRSLPGGGAEVTFRSDNAGLHHQLYVNGSLADWTEEPGERSFFLADLPQACRLVVVAVEASDRQTDFSSATGPLAPPPWVVRVAVPCGAWRAPGERVALLGDHARGQIDPEPLATADAWPAWAGHLGWGKDAFGAAAFGLDSSAAPGFSGGPFGAGFFGLDGQVVHLSAALPQEGLHRLVVRRIQTDGRTSDGPEFAFLSTPPPAAPAGIEATAYDGAAGTLTLQLERG